MHVFQLCRTTISQVLKARLPGTDFMLIVYINHIIKVLQKMQFLNGYSPLMDGVSQLQNQMLTPSDVPTTSLIFIFFVILHSNFGHIASK